MVLVDSNILIDIISGDEVWADWSEAALAEVADSDEVAINPIIYAEIAAGFASARELDAQLEVGAFRKLVLPYEAGFIAGRAFVEYLRRGGSRRSPLPDFYIGAHAAVEGMRLLTRDVKRYVTYFPSVVLIRPEFG